jgi:hypothetical protein
MPNILALVPIKPTTPPALRDSARRLLRQLEGVGERHARLCAETGDARPFSAHAAARNAMLDAYLKPEHTHVLWIDADLVDYVPDLAERLMAIDPAGIVAPFPLIEGRAQFYDTYGFVDADGERARPHGDHLHGGDVIAMTAVGTCYLAPARMFREGGVRYQPVAGHTEHFYVCDLARWAGVSIWAARRIVVWHANLPRHGEQWHRAEPASPPA